MVRAQPSKPPRTQSLLERIARAVCEEYRGDPDAIFAHRPMWHYFLNDARALLPVVVSTANEIAQDVRGGPGRTAKKPPSKTIAIPRRRRFKSRNRHRLRQP
jgi:hypothetical protein